MLTSLTTQNWEDPVSGYWLMWLACLRLRLRLGLRSRLGLFRGRWFLFLLSWRFRVFGRCWFGFFLLLSWLCFGFLLGGLFRRLGGRGSRLLLLSLLLCDPLVFRKHPVLQIRWDNTGSLLIRVDFDHAGGAGSSGPSCDASHKDSVDWSLEVFRGELPHRQPVRRSRALVMNN